MTPDVRDLITEHLRRNDSSWSIGGFGAIAEFHHVATSPSSLDGFTLRSPLGAIHIDSKAALRAIAYEIPSARSDYWQHGVALCLPDAQITPRPGHIVGLGSDMAALAEAESGASLFDLGVGTRAFRFCVRTRDAALIQALEASVGQPFLRHVARLTPLLLKVSPTRVALCDAGRIEVHQPIADPGGRTPDGPHTHLLPKLLRPHQTHSTNMPIPSGWLPVITLYPAHPLIDAAGVRKPFSRVEHDAFQEVLERFGVSGCNLAKRELMDCIHAGKRPALWCEPSHRHERLAARVAIRQLAHLEGGSPLLSEWRQRWDGARAASVALH